MISWSLIMPDRTARRTRAGGRRRETSPLRNQTTFRLSRGDYRLLCTDAESCNELYEEAFLSPEIELSDRAQL